MSWGVLVADFNNDGRDDQLVMRHSGAEDQIQLQQPDGTFRPYDRAIPGGLQVGHFPSADRHGCAAGDVNADGRTDLYCMLGGDGGEGVKSNELWIQQPDGTFAANQAAAWGVDDPFGRGRRPLLFDFDHIGPASDLYITNHGPRADGQRTENVLFLNNDAPAGRFTEKAVSATGSHGGVCVTSGSWDNDSFQDLVVCGDQLHLFHNDADPGGGRVTTQRDFLTGTPVAFPEDAKLADVNADGWPDLVIVTKTQLQVRLNLGAAATPTLRFPLGFSARLVDGKSVSVGDLTADGAPDIYVVQGSEPGPGGPRNAPDRLFAGPSWAEVGIPSVDTGTGDDSEFISIAGRKAVIVTNGRDFSRGPVQTITFSPASAEPPPQPPPAPAAAPPPVPPPTTTQALPSLPDPARVILLPDARRCVARRALRLRIQSSAIALRSAVVRVNGTRVRTVSRAELGSPVRLRRPPRRRFTVEVVVQTADGRALRRSRTYRRCRRG
jgi:hypothetical protein